MSDNIAELRGEILEAEKTRYDLLKWKLVLVSGLGAAGLGIGAAKGPGEIPYLDYLLCLIPLVCIYVDVLCLHMNLRIMVIAGFLRCSSPDTSTVKDYEEFANRMRKLPRQAHGKDNTAHIINVFSLEDWALRGSTVILSVLVVLYASVAYSCVDSGWWLPLAFATIPGLGLALGLPVVYRRQGTFLTVLVILFLFCIAYLTVTDSFAWHTWVFMNVKAWAVFLTAGMLGLLFTGVMRLIYRERCSAIDREVAIQCKEMTSMLVVHHPLLKELIKERYTATELLNIHLLLELYATFEFTKLENGLFPAAGHKPDASGYHYVWVRDNVFVAHAHYVNGRLDESVACALTLAAYFNKYRKRFQDVIADRTVADDPMKRPHVRFDGSSLEELTQDWPHAQNDALGYFLWLYARLTSAGLLQPTQEDMVLLDTFAQYFHAIRYWEDEDSGHWEENRKVSASSIGIVVGALQALCDLYELKNKETALLHKLIKHGRAALDRILPNECIQADPDKRRDCDAALLFLIYPVGVVEEQMADRILERVCTSLQGDYGIRRYQGDSYWCGDYKMLTTPEARTADFSGRMKERDALLKPGQEAQWCIFDPIISIIYGQRYQQSRNADDLTRQVKYFNRSLGQLTGPGSSFGECQCPEAYYLEDGRYVPNDQTPLLWTQANLWIAIKLMADNLI